MQNAARNREGVHMRCLQSAVVTVGSLLGATAAASAASPKVVWSEEAEKSVTPGGMRFGAPVADDAAASGGKAVRAAYQAGSHGWSIVFSAPRIQMRGQVLFTLWLREDGGLRVVGEIPPR
jgi:hypothetical protein